MVLEWNEVQVVGVIHLDWRALTPEIMVMPFFFFLRPFLFTCGDGVLLPCYTGMLISLRVILRPARMHLEAIHTRGQGSCVHSNTAKTKG
jgi:hypothetical protein